MKKIILQLISTSLLIMMFGFSFTSSIYATGTVYLMQDFENVTFPPSGWSVNSSGYPWIISTRTSGYGIGRSCACADFCNLPSGNLDLITSTFSATTSGDSLVFDHAYTCATTENDQLVIYYSTNGGSSWTTLVTLNGGPSGPLTTAPPTVLPFVPLPSQWATKSYILPVGTNALKFTGISAYGNYLYLDNIRVGAKYSNDVGVNSIFAPKWAINQGSVSPIGSVRNYGTTTQSFSVTLTINPGSYSNTQNITNLAPGQTQNVTFSSFNFNANGNYTLKAYTTLAGDQNHSNDTTTNLLIVTPAVRSVVLEFCTGTWCQWCPCGDRAADTLEAYYPNTIIFAYHGPTGSDPFATFNGNNIISLMAWTGYPSGNIDRRGNTLASAWGAFFSDGEYRYSQSPASPINIVVSNVNYNSSTHVLTANVAATALQTLSGSQYKINEIVTEDNLVYAQTGNSNCTGGSNWVHNWVTRNMINGATGDNVNSGTWTQGQTYNFNINTTLDNSWIAANCKLSVFIYDASGGTNNASTIQGGVRVPITPVGIQNNGNQVPSVYQLSQNYPNPFNPTTNINFAIPKGTDVKFKIYDITGKLVATYVDGYLKAGYYHVEFDGSNLASGVYFYTLLTSDFVRTEKMILVK